MPSPATYADVLRLSPDGKRLAMTVTEGGNQDVWVYDPQRDAMTRLTFGAGSYAASDFGVLMAGTSFSVLSAKGSTGRAPTAPDSRSL